MSLKSYYRGFSVIPAAREEVWLGRRKTRAPLYMFAEEGEEDESLETPLLLHHCGLLPIYFFTFWGMKWAKSGWKPKFVMRWGIGNLDRLAFSVPPSFHMSSTHRVTKTLI